MEPFYETTLRTDRDKRHARPKTGNQSYRSFAEVYEITDKDTVGFR